MYKVLLLSLYNSLSKHFTTVSDCSDDKCDHENQLFIAQKHTHCIYLLVS